MLKLRDAVPFSVRSNTPASVRKFVDGCLRAPCGITSSFRALPHFIVIGAQKSGTTSLQNYLVQHPEILWSLKKEVHYFDRNHDKSEGFYRSYFPLNYKIEQGYICGEASPSYVFYPQVADRIHHLLPDVKLIAILRNPKDRAISHYFHQVRWGNEHRSIMEALKAEEKRLNQELDSEWSHSQIARSFSYKRRGHYFEQLKRYERFFDNGQLLVLSSESLFSETHDAMRKIFKFLGVDPSFLINDTTASNVGFNKREAPSEVYQYLDEYFYRHNQDLHEYLGESFGW